MRDSHSNLASEDLCTGRGDAAATLGISVSTIDRLRESGELQTIKIGRRVLIRISDLRALIERRRQSAIHNPLQD